MAKSVLVRVPLVRAVLLGASALTFVGAPFIVGEAAAKVGVTSATDGDPLGKPPTEAERVLRIGIDVQANELITTNANDRAHLVFLDGSSLTVGPNAQLTIDKFVFDPSTKTGELAINASKGVLRLVGGKISKGQPITITTPSSTIGIRGGITILDVNARRTDSTFVFGKDMTVQAGGQTQTATRPGSMIVTNLGSAPGMPTLLAQGALNAQLSALEGRRTPQGSSSSSGGGRSADQAAQNSGFSNVNSGQSVRIVAPGVHDSFGSGPGARNRNPNDTIVTTLSNVNQLQQQSQGVQFQLEQQQQQQQQQQLSQQPALPPPPTSAPPQVPIQPDGGQTDISKINQMRSTATYAGILVGTHGNGIGQTGSYQNVWNFGARSGTASVSFGGANFQGTTFGNGNAPTFSTRGPITSSSNPDRKLEINGAFFPSKNDPTAFQVGNFAISGQRYQTGGVFGAAKQ
jgi:hypothetical protein